MSAVLNNALRTAWRLMFFTPIREVLGMLPWRPRRLSWRQMIAAADLPKPVQEKIEQVTVKSKLWNRERADVAEELIAHFEDGLEAGASAEGLAESFGDTKTAALLIRNAKRRCRPVWWQAWWWMSRSLLVFVPCYIVFALYLLTGRPKPTTNYLQVLNVPITSIPEEDRAWPLYSEAFQVLAGTPSNDVVRDYSATWGVRDTEIFRESYGNLTTDNKPLVDRWLDNHSRVLELFREATAKPTYGIPLATRSNGYSKDFQQVFRLPKYLPGEDKVSANESPWLFGILLPHVAECRSVARVLRLDLGRSVERGNAEQSYSDIISMLGAARHAGESPILIAGLVEVAIRDMAFKTIETTFQDAPTTWSDFQLRDLSHQLVILPRPLAFYLAGERTSAFDFIQRIYSEEGDITLSGMRSIASCVSNLQSQFDYYALPNPPALVQFGTALYLPVAWAVMADRAETIAEVNRFHDFAEIESMEPLWIRSRLDERMSSFNYSRNPVASLCFPAVTSCRYAFARSEGRRDGVLIGIALELYHREHGDWPGALSELAPRWLPEVPVDRINGGALGYVVIEGKPVVYSLGVDGDDDGGRMPKGSKGDQSYYVVGPPRAEVGEEYEGDWVIWSLVAPVEKNDDEE